MRPEDEAEKLARIMVRDAIRPLRNYRPPDVGAVAQLRGQVARARREGRQDALAEVLDAWRLTGPDDLGEFVTMLTERLADAGIKPYPPIDQGCQGYPAHNPVKGTATPRHCSRCGTDLTEARR
jgi:hypothetical protein